MVSTFRACCFSFDGDLLKVLFMIGTVYCTIYFGRVGVEMCVFISLTPLPSLSSVLSQAFLFSLSSVLSQAFLFSLSSVLSPKDLILQNSKHFPAWIYPRHIRPHSLLFSRSRAKSSSDRNIPPPYVTYLPNGRLHVLRHHHHHHHPGVRGCEPRDSFGNVEAGAASAAALGPRVVGDAELAPDELGRVVHLAPLEQLETGLVHDHLRFRPVGGLEDRVVL